MDNLSFIPFPNITTKRLLLRQISLNDADAFFALRSNKVVMQYIDRPLMTKIEEANNLILLIERDLYDGNGITWALSEIGNNKMIGTIGFWKFDKPNFRAEIGYLLDAQKQNQGIMTEAILATLQYAKNNFGLHSIEANINPNNNTSARLLEKCGFVLEAYYKENFFYNGKFMDTKIYSILTRNI